VRMPAMVVWGSASGPSTSLGATRRRRFGLLADSPHPRRTATESAKKDETPHYQHGYPNAESRGEEAEEQQPDARPYHHPIGHQRDGGPHRVQAGVRKLGV
jgi:hypothetical protein